MDARVVKMLVGDEIARIAQRAEPILGKQVGDVGEMIAEELACQFQNVKKQLLERLAEKENDTTPEELAKRWVDWRSKSSQVKATVSNTRLGCDPREVVESQKSSAPPEPVKPASPFPNPSKGGQVPTGSSVAPSGAPPVEDTLAHPSGSPAPASRPPQAGSEEADHVRPSPAAKPSERAVDPTMETTSPIGL